MNSSNQTSLRAVFDLLWSKYKIACGIRFEKIQLNDTACELAVFKNNFLSNLITEEWKF